MPEASEDMVIGNLENALEEVEDEEVAYYIRTALQLLADSD